MVFGRKYKLLAPQVFNITEPSYDSIHDSNDEDKNHKVSLYRIMALRDIPLHGVKKGDLGGWVSNKHVLSQQGECWIADEAKAVARRYMIGLSGLQVVDNALIKDNALVFSLYGDEEVKIKDDAVISDDAQVLYDILYQHYYGEELKKNPSGPIGICGKAEISGKARVVNPVVITSQVKGNSRCYASKILDEAVLYGDADLYGTTISGEAKVFGHARLLNSLITDRASCSNKSGANDLTMRDDSIVTDEAFIGTGALINGASKVFGKAFIGVDCRILGNSQIGGNVSIENRSTIVDEIRVPQKSGTKSPTISFANNDIFQKMNDPKETSEFLSRLVNSPEVDFAKKRLKKITDALESYRSDIVKILTYPILNDLTDERTLEMNIALSRVEELKPSGYSKDLIDAINELERKFMIAESNAHRIAGSLFSDAQRKKAETAKTLFSKATNEASTDNEKRLALKQGFKQLEGVVGIPDTAVNGMLQLAGIAELEA